MDTNNINPASNIVTLLAERGKNYDKTGEVVGFHFLSRKKSCLVFFPRGIKCEAGKEYRMELLPIVEQGGQAKLDRAGNPLYNSRPSPPVVSEKWIEEGGNLLHVRISTDWRLEAKRVALLETKKPATRERELYTDKKYELVWGTDLLSSAVMVKPETVVALEVEATDNGELVWKKISERRDSKPTSNYSLEKYNLRENESSWTWKRIDITHDPAGTVSLHLYFDEGLGYTSEHHHRTVWGDLPKWLKDELLVNYPICSCSRQRLDPSKNADGYSKCEICRTEEKCARCGKQPIAVKVVNNCLICDSCRPLVEQENLIHEKVSAEKLAELAAQAQLLLTGKVFEGETGEMVARTLVEQLKDESARREALRVCAGYPWYYISQDFIFGSKFGLEALEILCHINQAKGNGLVRLVSWVMGYHKTTDQDGDFYTRTQVKGEALAPEISSWSTFSDLAVGVCIFDFATTRRREEEQRQAEAAERSRLEKLLVHDYVRGDLVLATRIDAFVKEAFRIRGHHTVALLKKEDGEAYGRGGRTASIEEQFPGIDHQGLDWAAGRDIVPVAFWAETSLFGQVKVIVPTEGKFTFKTDRHFQCTGCGCIVNVAKPDWNMFRNGNSIKVSCPSCYRWDWVDSSIQKSQTKLEAPKPAVTNNGGSVTADALAALKAKFGGR